MAALYSSTFLMASIIAIGAFLSYRQPFTAEIRQFFVTVIVNVAMPCIILASIFGTPLNDQLIREVLITFAFSLGINGLGIFMGWLAARTRGYPSRKARELAILAGLGNTGFIGLPLCAALFGPKGALLAAVFDAGLDVIIWTVGVLLLQEGRIQLSQFRALWNVPMVAIVGGLTIAAIGWQPPAFAARLTETLANMAAPLAMLYIGFLIPGLWRRKKTESMAALPLPLAFKLVVFPLCVACLLWLLPLSRSIEQVVLIQTAMPTITMASILFAKCAADEELGAMATVVSTVLAMITIPIVVQVGMWIGQ